MPGFREGGRSKMKWMNNVTSWSRLTTEGAIRSADGREVWRKIVYDATNPRIEDGWGQDRTCQMQIQSRFKRTQTGNTTLWRRHCKQVETDTYFEVVAPPMSNGMLTPVRCISRATCTISSNDGVISPDRPMKSTSVYRRQARTGQKSAYSWRPVLTIDKTVHSQYHSE